MASGQPPKIVQRHMAHPVGGVNKICLILPTDPLIFYDWSQYIDFCWTNSATFSPFIFKIQSKRHWKDINLWQLFLVFLGFWAEKPKNTWKSHRKLMSFWCLFRLNFEDEGAINYLNLFLAIRNSLRNGCPILLPLTLFGTGRDIFIPLSLLNQILSDFRSKKLYYKYLAFLFLASINIP